MCDRWWEQETEWHRSWKGHFPSDWQEIVHYAQGGEKHIADVKTDQDWVLEFQHSRLATEERQARNDFYTKLIWVVDGLRRKTDLKQFSKAMEGKKFLLPQVPMCTASTSDCTLFQEWANNISPVFFDFGPENPLWCLLPGNGEEIVYVGPMQRQTFLGFHKTGAAQSGQDFKALLDHLNELISEHRKLSKQAQQNVVHQIPNFQNYPSRRYGRRL